MWERGLEQGGLVQRGEVQIRVVAQLHNLYQCSHGGTIFFIYFVLVVTVNVNNRELLKCPNCALCNIL